MTTEMNVTGPLFRGYVVFNVTNTMYLTQDFLHELRRNELHYSLIGFLKFCRWKPISLAPRDFIPCLMITQFIAPLS